jgi:hypothetical protein
MAKPYSAVGAMRQLFKAQKITRICLIVIATMALSLQIAAAQPPASVVILPFEVFAEKDLSYLQTEIPSVVSANRNSLCLKKVSRTGRCPSIIAGSAFRAGMEKTNG